MMKLLKNIFHKSILFVKNHKWISTGIVILIVVLFFIFRPKPQPPIAVITATRSHFVQSISVSGSVQAKNIANLSFLAGGKLVYLGVKKGDYVNKYQTIATLDLRSAQRNLQSALLDYSKQRNAFDQTQDNNQNRTPQQALTDAMKRILQNNQYDLDKSINSVELQSLSQEQSILTTPIAGVVTRADVTSAGVNVIPTTTFTVVDPGSVVFNMDVDEADIGKISTGQKVNVNLDAFPDVTLHQQITSMDFVSHATNTGGSAYTVEVKVPENTNYQYKVGMNGNGEIIIKEKDSVLAVPVSAIIDNKYVYVQTAHGFEKRTIKLGLQNDTQTEVVSGVVFGEKVALEPTKAAQQTGQRKKFLGFF